MSQKKRRSEDSGQGKKGSRRRSPTAGERESKSLPAFGFAEDLLAERKAQAAPPRPEDAAAEPPPAAAPPVAGPPRSDDPQRIFAFADSLETAAAREEPEAAPQRLTSWVTFRLAGETFALPVEPVREVLRVASITRVPHAPQPIRGVTNLRGRVIPVIDLRRRIGLAARDLDRASRVMVVASRGRLLGLLVDAVHQVLHIDLNRVQAPPEDVMTVQSDYILGVYHHGEQLILLFDVDRALVIKEAPRPQEEAS